MHPYIQHELARARVEDLHRQAERDRMARAARAAGRAQRRHHPQPAWRPSALASRLLSVLGDMRITRRARADFVPREVCSRARGN